jgi:hypothetical protein
MPILEAEPFHARYQKAMADRDNAHVLEEMIARTCVEFSLKIEQAFQ